MKDDLIKRQDAIDALENHACYGIEELDNLCNASVADSEGWLGGIRDAIKEVQGVPSAEPERKKGKWIYDTERVTTDGLVHSQYHCSNCGFQVTGWIPNYCQYCGADMRGE